jgi:hypothetical protein
MRALGWLAALVILACIALAFPMLAWLDWRDRRKVAALTRLRFDPSWDADAALADLVRRAPRVHDCGHSYCGVLGMELGPADDLMDVADALRDSEETS